MYKSKSLDSIYSQNKYSLNSSHDAIIDWINQQEDKLKNKMKTHYAFSRISALYDFFHLSQLENFSQIENLCIVSGTEEAELETKLINANAVYSTTLQEGFD